MESRHCGQDKKIFFCPVHNASTPCSLQAFVIRCMSTTLLNQQNTHYRLLLQIALTQVAMDSHTRQHLEIRNQDIFTILAERAPKARAASVRAFSRGVRGMLPRKFLNFLCLESMKIPQIYHH